MENPQRATTAAALLAWYREMGVDAVVGDAAIDWLARPDHGPGAGRIDRVTGKDATGAEPTRPSPSSAVMPPPQGTAERPRKPAPAAPRSQTATPPAPSSRLPSSGPRAPAAGERPTTAASPRAERQFPTTTPEAAEQSARAAAAALGSMAELRAALERFDGCALKATAKSLCLFRGAPQARLMIVGEAPGREEDLEGKPFVGRAGKLLDKMLAAIGLGEDDVHITNVVYWRPPGNRTPTPQETLVCRPFLLRQMELVRPDVLLLLGGPAAKAILDVTDGILKVRGRWREIDVGGRKVRVMPSLHPAYLLRTPAQKRLAWRDLLAVEEALTARSE